MKDKVVLRISRKITFFEEKKFFLANPRDPLPLTVLYPGKSGTVIRSENPIPNCYSVFDFIFILGFLHRFRSVDFGQKIIVEKQKIIISTVVRAFGRLVFWLALTNRIVVFSGQIVSGLNLENKHSTPNITEITPVNIFENFTRAITGVFMLIKCNQLRFSRN